MFFCILFVIQFKVVQYKGLSNYVSVTKTKEFCLFLYIV